jgi:hypothetical protein
VASPYKAKGFHASIAVREDGRLEEADGHVECNSGTGSNDQPQQRIASESA